MPKPITILAEGVNYMVVNKPAGLLTIPTADEKDKTLVNYLNYQFQDASFGLHPCHRLDRETSGVVLFAKGKKKQRVLMNEFQEKRVQKIYLAFVHGQLDRLEGEIKRPVKSIHKRRFAQQAPSQKALTRYRVVKEYADFSVVEVEPVTGRTNQIRIHFAQIGHPIVGESVYAFRKDFHLKFKRCALHAYQLTWKNPPDGKRIQVKAPLAQDMEQWLLKANS